jgi:hypothetical protein
MDSQESARAVLLRDVEPLDYSSSADPSHQREEEVFSLPERTRFNQLPRGLFDDVWILHWNDKNEDFSVARLEQDAINQFNE